MLVPIEAEEHGLGQVPDTNSAGNDSCIGAHRPELGDEAIPQPFVDQQRRIHHQYFAPTLPCQRNDVIQMRDSMSGCSAPKQVQLKHKVTRPSDSMHNMKRFAPIYVMQS